MSFLLQHYIILFCEFLNKILGLAMTVLLLMYPDSHFNLFTGLHCVSPCGITNRSFRP